MGDQGWQSELGSHVSVPLSGMRPTGNSTRRFGPSCSPQTMLRHFELIIQRILVPETPTFLLEPVAGPSVQREVEVP